VRGSFTQLMPSVRAPRPTLADLTSFFAKTAPVLGNQLRPFSIKAQPTAKLLAPATEQLSRSTPGLTTLARELNNIVNELAYKPAHGQGYLFYLPWANHNTNSVLSSQDGVGPLRQGELLFNCGTLALVNNYLLDPKLNPNLATLLKLLDVPSYTKYCKGTHPR
jgi:phospholipid/cholesterol/gamma-HCH transport system substrate-binding protein